MQNTLQQLRLHAVHNQSAPLWVEVMTSTHPAFNLFYVELHIPWLLIAGGAFGEQGKPVEVLFPMARDSRKCSFSGPVSAHPLWMAAEKRQGHGILPFVVVHLLAVQVASSFEASGMGSHSPQYPFSLPALSALLGFFVGSNKLPHPSSRSTQILAGLGIFVQ